MYRIIERIHSANTQRANFSLELVAAQRAAPMEQEAGSIEGRSPGSQAAGAQLGVGPKQARTEPPEAHEAECVGRAGRLGDGGGHVRQPSCSICR